MAMSKREYNKKKMTNASQYTIDKGKMITYLEELKRIREEEGLDAVIRFLLDNKRF